MIYDLGLQKPCIRETIIFQAATQSCRSPTTLTIIFRIVKQPTELWRRGMRSGEYLEIYCFNQTSTGWRMCMKRISITMLNANRSTEYYKHIPHPLPPGREARSQHTHCTFLAGTSNAQTMAPMYTQSIVAKTMPNVDLAIRTFSIHSRLCSLQCLWGGSNSTNAHFMLTSRVVRWEAYIDAILRYFNGRNHECSSIPLSYMKWNNWRSTSHVDALYNTYMSTCFKCICNVCGFC